MHYYYFLETALPPLEFPDKPQISFDQILHLYDQNLSKKDLKSVAFLRKYFDFQNIKALKLHDSFNSYGFLNKEELKKALGDVLYFGEEIYDFFKKAQEDDSKALFFPQIFSQFLDQQAHASHGFLKWFFAFEKNYRLILCAFRCKNLKRDITQELFFEDPLDPIVSEIFSQKDSPHFDSPQGYEDLAEVLQLSHGSPKGQYYALYEYRFRKVKQKIEQGSFTLDWFLGYMVLFTLLQEYHNVDSVEGAQVLNKMMKDV